MLAAHVGSFSSLVVVVVVVVEAVYSTAAQRSVDYDERLVSCLSHFRTIPYESTPAMICGRERDVDVQRKGMCESVKDAVTR